MEAKDTVMDWEQMVKYHGVGALVLEEITQMHDAVLEAQAEITWPIAKQAGIKEVVEWINEQRVAAKTLIEGTGWGIPISEEKLDAQLKEWGL